MLDAAEGDKKKVLHHFDNPLRMHKKIHGPMIFAVVDGDDDDVDVVGDNSEIRYFYHVVDNGEEEKWIWTILLQY